MEDGVGPGLGGDRLVQGGVGTEAAPTDKEPLQKSKTFKRPWVGSLGT